MRIQWVNSWIPKHIYPSASMSSEKNYPSSLSMMYMVYLCSIGWISGVLIGSLWWIAWLWIVLLLGIILSFWKTPHWYIIVISILGLAGGYSWTLWSLQHLEKKKENIGEIVWWGGFSHQIVWKTVSLLGVNEYNRRYEVIIKKIDEEIVSFSIAVIVPPNITLTPGDTVQAFGKFRFPEDTPEYAGEKTLWYRGMIAEFQSFQNTKQPPETYSMLVRIQKNLDKRLESLFPPSGYSLLSGILLGQRTLMDDILKDQLKASGLMHLMVVSGGNIMMLIIFLSLFIRSFPIWIRVSIIFITIFGFTLLVGGDMPVWRAALMGTIGYTASLWGYRFPTLILPLIVAVLISLWSPLALVYDIGLQLSFLSVVCIIVWWKKIAHILRFLGDFFSEAAALTIAATIGTFPITLFYFGTFSLIGPIANMIAAPVIPILMYSGILTLSVSFFSHNLAIWMGYIPWIGTTYLSKVITFFGTQKWSLITVDITHYRNIFISLSIGILFILIIKTYQTRQREN